MELGGGEVGLVGLVHHPDAPLCITHLERVLDQLHVGRRHHPPREGRQPCTGGGLPVGDEGEGQHDHVEVAAVAAVVEGELPAHFVESHLRGLGVRGAG